MRARAAWGLGVLLFVLGPGTLNAEGFRESISFQGYTGLLNVPTAEVTPDGRLDPVFTNQLDRQFAGEHTGARNYIFSVGLLPYVEIGGRLADSSRMMDLSGNLKVQVPFLPDGAPHLAVGFQDFAGAATKFQSRYAVATQALGPVRLSLGYGLGPDRKNGVFGGAEWQASSGLSLLADYDARDAHAGVRWLTPSFKGVRGMVMGQVPFAEPADLEVAVGLQVPMRRSYARPAGSAKPAWLAEAKTGRAGAAPVPADTAPSDCERCALRALKHALIDHGFEHVRVGLASPDVLYIEYENQRFAINELDALGLVLGTAAASAPASVDAFIVVAKKHQVPVLEVRGEVGSYRAFLRGASGAPLAIDQPPARYDHRATEWIGEDLTASRVWARVDLYPVFAHFVGTEVGALDLALSLGADVSVPLWRGALASTTWQMPMFRTRHFDEGMAFHSFRPSTGLRHAQVHQAVKLSPDLLTMVSVGLTRSRYVGALSDTIWSPGRGAHSLRARVGAFEPRGDGARKDVWLGTYRYYHAGLDASASATYGKYWYQDGGWTLELQRLFDDTAITLFYKNNTDHAAGVRISLPLTPRREPAPPRLVQIRGPDRVRAGLQTSLWRDDGSNQLTPAIAVIPAQRHDLERSFRNHDRLSRAYVMRHLPRMRAAYLRWGTL